MCAIALAGFFGHLCRCSCFCHCVHLLTRLSGVAHTFTAQAVQACALRLFTSLGSVQPYKGRILPPARQRLLALVRDFNVPDTQVTALFCVGNLSSALCNAKELTRDESFVAEIVDIMCEVDVDHGNYVHVACAYVLGNLSYVLPVEVGQRLATTSPFCDAIHEMCRDAIVNKDLFSAFWCMWSAFHVLNSGGASEAFELECGKSMVAFAAAFKCETAVSCMWTTFSGLFALLQSRSLVCRSFGWWTLSNVCHQREHRVKLLWPNNLRAFVDSVLALHTTDTSLYPLIREGLQRCWSAMVSEPDFEHLLDGRRAQLRAALAHNHIV